MERLQAKGCLPRMFFMWNQMAVNSIFYCLRVCNWHCSINCSINHSWCMGVVSHIYGEFVGGKDEGGG